MLAELESEYDFDYETERLRDYGEEALDMLGDIVDYESLAEEMEADTSPYELDRDWPDDEWLEADAWYEVTGEYEED